MFNLQKRMSYEIANSPKPVRRCNRTLFTHFQHAGGQRQPVWPAGPRPGHLRIASVGDSRPYTFTDSSGQFTGFDVDFVKNVAHRMGIDQVDFVGQDFSAILPAVANGQFDATVAAICITPGA